MIKKTFETVVTIDYIATSRDDIVAYRKEIVTNGGEPIVHEGLINKDKMEWLESSIESKLFSDDHWFLYSPDFLEWFARYRYNAKVPEPQSSLTPYSDLKAKRNVMMIRNSNSYDGMARKANGELLPAAMYFDYVRENMRSEEYDLVRVRDSLLKRNDILELSEIKPIPYYNNTTGNEKFIEFLWSPSAEDYARMWDVCQRLNKEYPCAEFHAAQEELDILNLQQFRLKKNKRNRKV